jgi:MFS family permease
VSSRAPAAAAKGTGLVMAAGAVAVAVGPLIGGFATTYFSWRWVFVGEVLVVLGILVLARRVQDAPPESRPKLDLVGTLLSATGLGLSVFGVLRSSEWGWALPRPDGPVVLGVSPVVWLVLGGLFVVWLFLGWERRLEAKGAEPLVRPELRATASSPAGWCCSSTSI